MLVSLDAVMTQRAGGASVIGVPQALVSAIGTQPLCFH